MNGTFQFVPIAFTYGNPFYLLMGLGTVAGTRELCLTC